MVNCTDESLFSRFAPSRAASHQPRKKPGRSVRDLDHFHRHHQALSQSATRVGHVLPKPIPGRPSIKGAALQAGLLDQLRTHPDATREQHCQMWETKTGTKVSPASISRVRMALGWTRKKKTLVASEQDEAERTAWREQARELPTQDLVIVDETGSRINMTPMYAYAPRGKRAIGKVPRNLWGKPDIDRIPVA